MQPCSNHRAVRVKSYWSSRPRGSAPVFINGSLITKGPCLHRKCTYLALFCSCSVTSLEAHRVTVWSAERESSRKYPGLGISDLCCSQQLIGSIWPLRVVDCPQRSWKLRSVLSLVPSCVRRAPLSQWPVGNQLQKAAVATSAPIEIFKGSSSF